MEQRHKDILITNRVRLVEEVQIDEVWSYLIQEKIITPRVKSRLTYNKDMYAQVEGLLDELPRCGPKAFDVFCRALRETSQEDLVDSVLKPKQCSRQTHTPTMETGEPGSKICSVMQGMSKVTVQDTEDFSDAMRDSINIITCTLDFFEREKKWSYPMSEPRGLALIINVRFDGKTQARPGTDVDAHNLKLLLQELRFTVIEYNDNDGLSAQEIKDKLSDFASREDHQHLMCTVVCILSHGDEDSIKATDQKAVKVDKITNFFTEKNCPHLAGKPKLFFFQACRGVKFNEGVTVPVHPSDDSADSSGFVEKADGADFLFAFPTQKGDFAFRNETTGSWFIQAIVDVFSKHSHHLDVCSMLNLVNDKIARRFSKCSKDKKMDHKFQMSEYKSTLTRARLHFFPGI